MIGILAEKPSQARGQAAALGGMTGTYKGEDYIIVPARGHLYEFVDPSLQVPQALSNKYKSWDLANLPWNEKDFSWKRQEKEGVSRELAAIKRAFDGCDEICIATDDDPTGEGELLAWEILDALKFNPKKWTRMYFVDESKKEIQKAFENRKTLPGMEQDPDYIKALFRSKWDLLSMQWTRIATKSCGKYGVVIREGRLKSAMKKIVGDQLIAISKYKKVAFYQNRFRDENNIMYINPSEPQYEKKNEVPNIYHDSDVVIDSIEQKTTPPPKLLDLAGLSARLAPKGIPSKRTLEIYQSMYEAGIVSYPRTEDKFITPEQFNDLLPLIDTIADLVGVDKSLLTHRQPRPTHVKVGCAHGANRPGLTVPKSLEALDAQFGKGASDIYVMLAKNYLSILGEDYEYEFQKGHVKDFPKFVGTANVPKKLGYKAIFSDVDEDEKNDTSKGLGKHANPFIHEGFPPKPKQPTMIWLFKQLEKYDVGTGATRTSTYSEISNSKDKNAIFIDKKGKIDLTEVGWLGYNLLPGTHISDLEVTEKVMTQMKMISKGQANPDECLHEIQQLIIDDLEVIKNNAANAGIVASQSIVKKEKYTGTWKRKEVTFSREWNGHYFTDEECEKLCKGEEIIVSGLVAKSGKEYAVVGKLANLTFNGNKYVGFERTGFANSNTSKIPDEWCQHKFTEQEKKLLESGQQIELKGCVSKAGKSFNAKVRWGKNEKGYDGIIPEFF